MPSVGSVFWLQWILPEFYQNVEIELGLPEKDDNMKIRVVIRQQRAMIEQNYFFSKKLLKSFENFVKNVSQGDFTRIYQNIVRNRRIG